MIISRFLRLSSLYGLLLLFSSVKVRANELDLVHQSIKALTDVMMYDITSPPVASRNYAYSLIAFYEAARQGDTRHKSFAGKLNGLGALPSAPPGEEYNWLIAGTAAFHKTAYAFIFSKNLFQKALDSLMLEINTLSVSRQVYERSRKYGELIGEHILKWASGDNYLQMRSMQRFTQGQATGMWQQTPPDYLEAVEPNWKKLRPMMLTRADEFKLPAPPSYNTTDFLKECRFVYETSLHLTKKQKEIAKFWDCNPFATETMGHFVYSEKKMSPGGHWIGITGIAIKKKGQSLEEALWSYSLVSIVMYDAFIAAWAEKFSSNYIRPVTAIQQLLSPAWQPLLQTPPFPEYPSGHSVVSMASAVILTNIFGDNFRYKDSCEREFGLPDRMYNSFYEAAAEAAISRLYGGIHFMPAIENGKELGRKVGGLVLDKIN